MHRILRALVIAACTGFLGYQVYLNIETFLKHKTATRKSSKALISSAFPALEICLNPGFDKKVLKSQNYESLHDYVLGLSNGSLIGWAGPADGVTTDLLAKAYIWKNQRDVFQFETRNIGAIKSFDHDFVEVGAHHPYGKCFAFNTRNIILKPSEEPHLIFKLNEMPQTKVTFFITDPHRMSWKRDLFTYSGDQIYVEIDPASQKYDFHYEIQVSETVESNQDLEAHCMDSLASKYGHYKTCSLVESHNYFLSQIGCIPPWFVYKDDPNICQHKLTPNLTTGSLNIWYFFNKIEFKVYQTLSIWLGIQFRQRYGQIKDRRSNIFLNIFGLA